MDQIPARSLSNNRTILVVEDEKLMLHLLEKVFLQHGYQVMAVSDGEEAMEVYSCHKSKIDVADGLGQFSLEIME